MFTLGVVMEGGRAWLGRLVKEGVRCGCFREGLIGDVDFFGLCW